MTTQTPPQPTPSSSTPGLAVMGCLVTGCFGIIHAFNFEQGMGLLASAVAFGAVVICSFGR